MQKKKETGTRSKPKSESKEKANLKGRERKNIRSTEVYTGYKRMVKAKQQEKESDSTMS